MTELQENVNRATTEKEKKSVKNYMVREWVKNNQNSVLSLEHEEWRPTIYKGITIPNYRISNFGRLQIISEGKIVNPSFSLRLESVGSYAGREMRYSLSVKDARFHQFSGRPNRTTISISAHILVVNAFIPFDLNPPVPLEVWERTPKESQEYMRDCSVLDHIDNNPFNNHVSNLRWTTPKGNNSHVKKVMIEKGLIKVSNFTVLNGSKTDMGTATTELPLFDLS